MKALYTLFAIALTTAASAQTNTPQAAPYDRTFLRQAILGNSQEVLLGGLAQTNSEDPNVQDFGGVLVTDHSTALDQAQTLAANLGISSPSTNTQTRTLVRRFGTTTGSRFDQAFLTLMIRNHMQDIQRYANAALRARDPDVRDFARNQLPILTQHLVSVLSIRELTNTNTNTGTGTGSGDNGGNTGGSGTGNGTGTGSGSGTGTIGTGSNNNNGTTDTTGQIGGGASNPGGATGTGSIGLGTGRGS